MKKGTEFFSDRKLLMLLLSLLFHLKNSQFFEILIFSQDIWGNVHYVPEINLISSIFFTRNVLFQQVLRFSAFVNSKCLTFFYLLSCLFL